MRRACKWISAAWLSIMLLAGAGAAFAQAAAPQGDQKPAYTLAEYNAFQAAHNDQNAQTKIKALDDFVAKYPMSALLPYVYRDYYLAYYQQKNYAQTLAYVDKLLALGDKVDFGSRLEAMVARGQAFYAGSGDKSLQTPEQYTKARETSAQGIEALSKWMKPEKMTDEQFAQQKKSIGIVFNLVAGIAASGLKDYKGAVGFV